MTVFGLVWKQARAVHPCLEGVRESAGKTDPLWEVWRMVFLNDHFNRVLLPQCAGLVLSTNDFSNVQKNCSLEFFNVPEFCRLRKMGGQLSLFASWRLDHAGTWQAPLASLSEGLM